MSEITAPSSRMGPLVANIHAAVYVAELVRVLRLSQIAFMLLALACYTCMLVGVLLDAASLIPLAGVMLSTFVAVVAIPHWMGGDAARDAGIQLMFRMKLLQAHAHADDDVWERAVRFSNHDDIDDMTKARKAATRLPRILRTYHTNRVKATMADLTSTAKESA